MKYYILIACATLWIFSFGCSREYELEKSVFTADSVHTDLPAYTEWGYNTFGAYFDREAFISNNSQVPGKFISMNGISTFVLKGQKGAYSYYYWRDEDAMAVSFTLPGFSAESYANLEVLNDTVIDLTNQGCRVFITMDTTKTEVGILNGQLHFKRAQKLLVDNQQVEVILSGYFSFQMLFFNEPITMSYGRFDVGIGENNFFNY